MPSSVTPKTIKQLFAKSGNKCAMRHCKFQVCDSFTNSIICEICHIKGEKKGSARYDQNQTDEERNAYQNLLLLCGSHHKTIDDDENTYTVEMLTKMKYDHEQSCKADVTVDFSQFPDDIIERILEKTKALTGKITIDESYETISSYGSPILVITISNIGEKKARISGCNLCIDKKDMLKRFSIAFDCDFTVQKPEIETLQYETLSLPFNLPFDTKENTIYTLEQHDVCKFVMPFHKEVLAEFVCDDSALPYIIIQYPDNTEIPIIDNKHTQEMILDFIDRFYPFAYRPKTNPSINISVASLHKPDDVPFNITNPKRLSYTNPDKLKALFPPDRFLCEITPKYNKISDTDGFKLGFQIVNTGKRNLLNISLQINFPNRESYISHYLLKPSNNTISPNNTFDFILDDETNNLVHNLMLNYSPELYTLRLNINNRPLKFVHGMLLYSKYFELCQMIQYQRIKEVNSDVSV